MLIMRASRSLREPCHFVNTAPETGKSLNFPGSSVLFSIIGKNWPLAGARLSVCGRLVPMALMARLYFNRIRLGGDRVYAPVYMYPKKRLACLEAKEKTNDPFDTMSWWYQKLYNLTNTFIRSRGPRSNVDPKVSPEEAIGFRSNASAVELRLVVSLDGNRGPAVSIFSQACAAEKPHGPVTTVGGALESCKSAHSPMEPSEFAEPPHSNCEDFASNPGVNGGCAIPLCDVPPDASAPGSLVSAPANKSISAITAPPKAPPSCPNLDVAFDIYEAENYPDKYLRARPELMLASEKRHCKTLRPFWGRVRADQVTDPKSDEFHDLRVAEIGNERGDREVELELNTLGNVIRHGKRRGVLPSTVPQPKFPVYCPAASVVHCRKFMPYDADELNRVAGFLYQKKKSAFLGFQADFEGRTGLRSIEAVKLRVDAAPYEPGWISEEGTRLYVRRAKGQENERPFVLIDDFLRELLDAMKRYRELHYPHSPWYFPSYANAMKHVGKCSLTRALARLAKKGLCRKLTSHGLRAFYVTVRRSHGIFDAQIAYEIGHTSGGRTIADVYGKAPASWDGGAPLSFMPKAAPAWNALVDDAKADQSAPSPAKA